MTVYTKPRDPPVLLGSNADKRRVQCLIPAISLLGQLFLFMAFDVFSCSQDYCKEGTHYTDGET